MNKSEFLTVLKRNLSKLPKEEIDSAISFYEEYFNDAGEKNEQEVIKKLGSPQAVAAKIIGEFALKDIEAQKERKKSRVSIWFIILAIFASPIVLPMGFVVVSIFIILLVSLISIYLSFFTAGAGIICLGLASLVSAFNSFALDIPTGFFFTGMGILGTSIGIAAIIGTIQLTKITVLGIKKALSNFLLRRNTK